MACPVIDRCIHQSQHNKKCTGTGVGCGFKITIETLENIDTKTLTVTAAT